MLRTVIGRIEETAAPRADGNLGRTLGGRIGIVAPHWLVLSITPDLFTVLVAFVSGDHDGSTDAVGMADGFHDVDGTHDVSFVGLYGNVVAEAYQRLGSQVEHHLGLVLVEDVLHLLAVTDIGTDIGIYLLADA